MGSTGSDGLVRCPRYCIVVVLILLRFADKVNKANDTKPNSSRNVLASRAACLPLPISLHATLCRRSFMYTGPTESVGHVGVLLPVECLKLLFI